MQSTNRVKEILSWYGSDHPGVLANLTRIMNTGRLAGTGKFVILPVDQGFEHGPARSFASNPPAYNPHYHFQWAIDVGCNAFAAPLGMLEAGAHETDDELLEQVRGIEAGEGFGSSIGCNSFARKKDEALKLLDTIMDTYAGKKQ